MNLAAITDRRNRSIDQFANHKVSGQKDVWAISQNVEPGAEAKQFFT